MKNLVFCVALNVLFFINTVYSSVQLTPSKSRTFKSPSSFSIECNVSFDIIPSIKWKKNDVEVTTIKVLQGRVKQSWDNDKKVHKLTVDHSIDSDAGNYSCIAYREAIEVARADIVVANYVAVDVPNNVNVVEEERLRIECKLIGNASLHWIFQEEIYNETRDRIKLENFTYNGKDYENGVFIIEKIGKADKGIVTCVGVEILTQENATSECTVRVKDKYAALWPFLGICAEVIILCAIIVIYEKKRNKSELEESDTDQSPDQKNTPEQGKESNLRHRQ